MVTPPRSTAAAGDYEGVSGGEGRHSLARAFAEIDTLRSATATLANDVKRLQDAPLAIGSSSSPRRLGSSSAPSDAPASLTAVLSASVDGVPVTSEAPLEVVIVPATSHCLSIERTLEPPKKEKEPACGVDVWTGWW